VANKNNFVDKDCLKKFLDIQVCKIVLTMNTTSHTGQLLMLVTLVVIFIAANPTPSLEALHIDLATPTKNEHSDLQTAAESPLRIYVPPRRRTQDTCIPSGNSGIISVGSLGTVSAIVQCQDLNPPTVFGNEEVCVDAPISTSIFGTGAVLCVAGVDAGTQGFSCGPGQAVAAWCIGKCLIPAIFSNTLVPTGSYSQVTDDGLLFVNESAVVIVPALGSLLTDLDAFKSGYDCLAPGGEEQEIDCCLGGRETTLPSGLPTVLPSTGPMQAPAAEPRTTSPPEEPTLPITQPDSESGVLGLPSCVWLVIACMAVVQLPKHLLE
jgi:hypothetical protein